MRPVFVWSFALFNLAILLGGLALILIDAGILPGHIAWFDIFGRFFVYESIALLAITVNLTLAILALMSRRS